MKKFFTIVPLQVPGQLREYVYEAVDNSQLQMSKATCFPILTAINGYAAEGEDIRVIAVTADTEPGRHNLEILSKEVEALCAEKGIVCAKGVEGVLIPPDSGVAAQVNVFQKLIDCVEDDDKLFACMTYGEKPQTTALLMAVQYAYRIKRNTMISCIVYGQIHRPDRDPQTWVARVYDMTALIQLDEIVRLLAERGVENPKEMIDRIIAL